MTTAKLCIFTKNFPFKKSQKLHENRHVPALGATSIPRPCRGGERGGVSVIFHTCYWRDIRAVFILLTPVPVIVYLREGDITDPTPAPPLQGRGTGCVSSSELWNWVCGLFLAGGLGVFFFEAG